MAQESCTGPTSDSGSFHTKGASDPASYSEETATPGISLGAECFQQFVQEHEPGLLDSSAKFLQDSGFVECAKAQRGSGVRMLPDSSEPCTPAAEELREWEEQSVMLFDKRPSYLRIVRRLRSIRVFPALTACTSALLVTAAVCGAEIAFRAADISSAFSLLGCSILAFLLAVIAAHTRSHFQLVGLLLLEVIFTLYATAFGSIGIVNVKQLLKRQMDTQQDLTMQEEQRDNAMKVMRRMLIEHAIFSGLYFFVAASHCCAAASVNHLRGAVQPFDSRLRRKRQRARAIRLLGVIPVSDPEGSEATRTMVLKEGSTLENHQSDFVGSGSQMKKPEAYGSCSGQIEEAVELQHCTTGCFPGPEDDKITHAGLPLGEDCSQDQHDLLEGSVLETQNPKN
ncbi:hypothetical protein cyc_00207 [Cyclospora cayetanensis]|uniref:Transmembrane protein n=1 Tax=Cyclospora cayetanensis TaxID=88456 RepID=A0A1D3D697_9EIME|nr:hypothetical protein cyc_00207 [Cyclospora cayetanensis]